ncbi:MAG: FecR domain-containing protein [Mediterranea sp.]|jgi:ferric-dicitrate binding protein FerR (iron transport regulator)|nr:FecR domain-containing protein [Mediterranea sp.]
MKLLPSRSLGDYLHDLKKSIPLGAFGRWFVENESNPEVDEELRKLWEKSADEAIDPRWTAAAFANVREAIGDPLPSRREALFARTMRYLTRAAAILLIPLMGITMYLYLRGQESHVDWIEVYAGFGQKKEVVLPDKSTLWLNSGTRVIYPERFGHVRQIFVSGETFLDVSKDPERPFIVDTKDVRITVHGTRFNVRSYTEDKGTEATLLEGSISLLVKGGQEERDVYLAPGEKAILANNRLSLESFDVATYRSWRNGQYTFRDKTLQEIITELQRVFNVQIVIRDKTLLKDVFFVTFAQGLSLDQMLEALNIDDGLSITRDGDIIEISPRTR